MAKANLKVMLLRATPDPDEVVALGARLCYAQAGLDALRERVETTDQQKYIAGGGGRVSRAARAADAAPHRQLLRAKPALCLHGGRL